MAFAKAGAHCLIHPIMANLKACPGKSLYRPPPHPNKKSHGSIKLFMLQALWATPWPTPPGIVSYKNYSGSKIIFWVESHMSRVDIHGPSSLESVSEYIITYLIQS